MTQPETPHIRPLLVGSGRLFKHLHHYFHQIEFPHGSWEFPRDLSSAFFDKAERYDAIWLLVSDRAIPVLSKEIRTRLPHVRILHSSGSLSLPNTLTLHPLFTFGPELYEDSVYQTFPFTVIEEEIRDSREWCDAFFALLKNPRVEIKNEFRTFYHAAACIVSNFPQILWSETEKEIKTHLSIDPKTYLPLLTQASKNFFSHGEASLTGPLVRGDQVTLEKHVAALKNSKLLPVYEAFIKLYQSSIGESR